MPISDEREYRNLMLDNASITEEGYIEGYATTFGDKYLLRKCNDCEYYETIDKGAFDNCDMSDVILQVDHSGKVYARTKNDTVSLKIDERGLFQRSYLNGTNAGRELLEEIRGGYYDRMSFGFIVGEDSFEKIGDNKYLRHVKSIRKLFDVSVVSFPANPFTSLCARSNERIEEFDSERLKEIEERATVEALEKRRNELLNKFRGTENDN